MLLSYDWLAECVDLAGITAEEVADKLTMTGIEATVKRPAQPLEGIVIGHVLSVEKHPEADRLNLCIVDVGQEENLQIVCGASNVVAGAKVPVATVGSVMPDGLKIKKAKLRGVESCGMICSAAELGLTLLHKADSGIMILEPEAIIGQSASKYLGLMDSVLELELTANRADCLSMLGVSYEVAAIFDRKMLLRLPLKGVDLDSKGSVAPACMTYALQALNNIKITNSPRWMQNKLIASGIRPINNIVDLINYVMLETGQPMHAFDADKVGSLSVRYASEGEKLVTLDGVERVCNSEMLLIADENRALALAGIMGGADSGVTDQTVNILVEAALFDATVVRKTSRKLGLHTDSASRFEKGVNREITLVALARFANLCTQLGWVADVHPVKVYKQAAAVSGSITLRYERIARVLGFEIAHSEVVEFFRRLGLVYRVDSDKRLYSVDLIARRPDLISEIDIIEEIARIYGYDRIKPRALAGEQTGGLRSREQQMIYSLKERLSSLGMSESITYSLISESENERFGDASKSSVKLAMPMSSQHAVLRTSLLASLLKSASYNLKYGNSDVALFELAEVYSATKDEELPTRSLMLAALVSSKADERQLWKAPSVEQFYILKGRVEQLLNSLGITNLVFEKLDSGEAVNLHPGRAANIYSDSKLLGRVGEIYPTVADEYDLPRSAYFELDVETLLAEAQNQIFCKTPSRFPSVTRDIAVVVDEKTTSYEIEEGICRAAGELLEKVRLFDVFQGEQIASGKKGMTYALCYRAENRTLTDQEVDESHAAVIDYLGKSFGAFLRS